MSIALGRLQDWPCFFQSTMRNLTTFRECTVKDRDPDRHFHRHRQTQDTGTQGTGHRTQDTGHRTQTQADTTVTGVTG